MKKFVLIVSLMFSLSAHAWGPREQGALAGFAAGVLINQHMNGQHRQHHHIYTQPAPQPPMFVYPPNPVVVYPPTYEIRPEHRVIVCHDYQNFDKYGRPYGIQRICR